MLIRTSKDIGVDPIDKNNDEMESVSISWRVVHRLQSTKGTDRKVMNISTLSMNPKKESSILNKVHNQSGLK